MLKQSWRKQGATLLAVVMTSLLAFLFPSSWGKGDFFSYWLGARQLLEAQNPYDLEIYRREFDSHFGSGSAPAILYAPPHVLGVILWIGLFDYPLAWTIWIFLTTASVVLITVMLSRQFELGFRHLYCFVSFPPFLHAFSLGQVVFIPYLGLLGFILAGRRSPLVSGCCLGLTIVKPHIFGPLLLQVFLSKPSRQFILGFGAMVLLLLSLPLAFDSAAFSNYANANLQDVFMWQNPVVAAYLQHWIEPRYSWLRFVPFVGLCVFVFFRNQIQLKTIPLCHLLIASLASAPYLWTYDFIFLIPSLVLFLAQSSNPGARILWIMATNVLLFLSLKENQWSIWYPWAILLLLLFYKPIYSPTDAKFPYGAQNLPIK